MGFPTLHHHISSVAVKYPDQIAIEKGREAITYGDLDQKTDQMAKFLYSYISDAKTKNISILLNNSIELVMAILGVLKAGGVFAPIDPSFPESRIKYMVEKINSDWIITNKEYLNKLDEIAGVEQRKINVIILDSTADKVQELQKQYTRITIYTIDQNLPQEISLPDGLINKNCYIYFTSGSTGKPKSILGRHRSLKHFVDWEIKEFGINESFRIGQLTTPSFDPFLRDIFVPLFVGGTICIPETREIVFDPQLLKEWISKSNISLIHTVPTIFRSLLEFMDKSTRFENLKYILVAGEMLRGTDIRKFFEFFGDEISLVNLYGPTETTLAKMFYRVKKEDINLLSVPVGKAIPGAQVMILDEKLKPCDPNSIGEIYIRTPYTSAGYYDDPEATKKVFIQNPFNNNPRDRIYKTGDLGMVSSTGIVEIVGRVDNQIKIRGVRIEPGEIEAHLLEHPEIKETVVTVTEDDIRGANLCAYLVATKEVNSTEMRAFLAERLPNSMIPTYFIQIERVPLTPNGKVDRKALSVPMSETDTEYVEPVTDLERELSALWTEVLHIEKIGVNHIFFNLGGNSLKATILSNKIHRKLNVKVPMEIIFTNPTIRGLSNYIRSVGEASYDIIENVDAKEYYEASSAEKRMFLLQQHDINSTRYNISASLKVHGRLDLDQVEWAISELIKRHETLRTSFGMVDGTIVQRINQNIDFKVEYLAGNGQSIDAVIKNFIRPFDLSKAPLLRFGVLSLSKTENMLIFDIHHIISDGVSMGIFVDEFTKLYAGQELDKLGLQYKDYSEWQNKQLMSERMVTQKDYWHSRFAGQLPTLDLPLDYPRPENQNFAGDVLKINISDQLRRGIYGLLKQTESTMYMVVISAIYILLSKYSGQEDIIIGSPISGRNHPDLDNLIGMFVNTLAMRNKPEGNKRFLEFLKEVKHNTVKAFEHQDYSFEELIQHLNLKRASNKNPLFDVMFVMQNFEANKLELGDLMAEEEKRYNDTSKFDLTFIAQERGEELILEVEYNTTLFQKSTVEGMTKHLVNILRIVTDNQMICLNEIELCTEEEKNQIFTKFNDTKAHYPDGKTIQELFVEQVVKNPDKTAVVYKNKGLTYKELDNKSNRLARTLKDFGIKADTLVGIVAEKSVETIIGILAILKAGGAYLPIDLSFPKERINLMLKESSVEILLTQSALNESIELDCTNINLLDETVYSTNFSSMEIVNNAKSLAYVMFTSGSTGVPKGVMIEHKNVVRLVKNTNYIEFSANDKILQTGPFAFDASTFEMWGVLLNGLELHLSDKDLILRSGELEEYLIRNNITIMFLTTSLFNILANENPAIFKTLKYLFVGGDTLSPDHINSVKRSCYSLNLRSVYGPTENTTFSTYFPINKEFTTNIPIGSPISNSTVYILDKDDKLCPVGLQGELCVGGAGLARGYLNKPEVTKEKFIENPYKPGEIIYKTGDLGRWLPDGIIEFLGRIDHQLKIRGYRIEPGEIEYYLMKYEDTREAVVLGKENEQGDKYLVAYFTADGDVEIGELKNFLTDSLPNYMVPAYFVQLDKMPLNNNGKIDRDKLPVVANENLRTVEYRAPENELEEKLVIIFQEILKVKQVGINDDFFELGGHSLKATILANKIHKELNFEILLTEIFRKSTVKELAQLIKNKDVNQFHDIEPIEERNYYQVSSAQKRLYILDQLEDIGVSYNMPQAMIVKGKLDKERLNNTVDNLIMRHETLRTSFHTHKGEIVQKVHLDADLKISYLQNEGREIKKLIQDFIRPFNLGEAPLLRIGLTELEKEKYLLLFDMHHIISDGTSMNILTKDFINLYNGEKLDKLAIQYKDFAAWQNKMFSTNSIKKHKQYWIEQFAGEIPILNMPLDYPRPAKQSFEGKRLVFAADSQLSQKLNLLAEEKSVTLYMVLLAAYNVLLSKYSGQEDIIVGTPLAGRTHSELEDIIGMFVNTLAMRNYPKATFSFKEFLEQVKDTALEAYDHQDYQLEQLVKNLNIPRDLNRNPLFDTIFALQNMSHKNKMIDDMRFSTVEFDSNTAKFDLELHAIEINDQINFTLHYNTELFKNETIERLVKHYLQIIKGVVENPEIIISDLEMLSKEEKEQLLFGFNNTYAEFLQTKTIYQLFEEQAIKTPDQIAAIFPDKTLTYREINQKSNQLARILRNNGLHREEVVGIMLQRSPEMIIGIFAIIKARGAYLSIDPEYPNERIKFMLRDSNAKMLLTIGDLQEDLEFRGQVFNLLDERLYSGKTDPLPNINTSNDLAYIIYTSGSTGIPKGVMIEHQSVVNRLNWMQRRYPLEPQDVILQKTPFTFDVSVWELFWWSIVGAKVYFLEPNGEKDPEIIVDAVDKFKITIMHFVPSMLAVFLNYLENFPEKIEMLTSLKRIFASGEALKTKQVKDFNQLLNQAYGVKLHNLYGPTEATVDVTYFDCLPEKKLDIIPIGKPIDNTQIYILDKYNKLQPVGIVGELHIGGVGLSRGYLNREDLTKKLFIQNPYKNNDKIYKTGDLARWLSDGNIEYLGRIDNQVKMRGYRIELGEIEARLLELDGIKEVVVLVKNDSSGDGYISAYYVGELELSLTKLRTVLLTKLPDYMIPTYFVKLKQIPLTPNGKIDRQALPKPNRENSIIREYIAPTNEVEEKLAEIWSELLQIDQIGINDNIVELGGHSLKATSFAARVFKEFNVEIPLRELFKTPTIKELARYIESAEKNIYTSIEPVEEREYYPVSSAQKRLFILNQYNNDSINYNMPRVMKIEGEIDQELLENAFIELVQRHESLRTSFATINGEIVQKVHKNVDFKVAFIEANEKEVNEIIADFIKPFDLDRAPLFRVRLIQLPSRYVLMYDMHHIISDGTSMNILTTDFVNLYNGEKLDKLTIQFKDFAVWQNKAIFTDSINKQKQYWIEQFASEIPVLNMPLDYPRPAKQSFEGKRLVFEADSQLSQKLNLLAEENSVTLYMVLLAAYNVLLSKYSGQEDIIVGTPSAGRTHSDLENIIGMFVNTLPMRNYPKATFSFQEFLRQVKDTALKAYDNQDYQFEQLVEDLNISRDLSRNPLFDTVFTMQNTDFADISLEGLSFVDIQFDYQQSKFDLNLTAHEHDKKILFNLTYCTKLFKEEIMEKFTEHYLQILHSITDNAEVMLSNIEMISSEEKQQVLYDFNDSKKEYQLDLTVIDLFEKQVESKPLQTALVAGDKKLTYQELNTRSNKLAHLLKEKGVTSETIVAILADNSPEMVISVMAILKAGGAYLPIDLNYPTNRVKYILKDSGAEILLAQNDQIATNELDFAGEVIRVSGIIADVRDISVKYNSNNPEKVISADNLAYVIYTSGSTGNPKGVMVEHRSLTNLICWYIEFYGITAEDRCSKYAGFGFDASVGEIFYTFSTGAALYIIDEEIKMNVEKLNEYFEANSITFGFLPTQLYEQFMEYNNNSLRKLVTAGDELKRFVKQNYQLYNSYGPTEATMASTTFPVDQTYHNIPIGKPMSNVQVYIIDQNAKIQPIGVPGELCIGGEGLARGYLNKPELTAEKFVSNPFIPNAKLYRSGDLARWLPDGNLEFRGRMDDQVQIRGFRVEPGEIETRLIKHNRILESVVLTRENAIGDKYLCAYLVTQDKVIKRELRDYLARELPDYMIPAYFVFVDQIPINAHGKVDKKALPEPDLDLGNTEYEAPMTKIEDRLVTIWSEELEVEGLGITHDFFELGGHSLKAMNIIAQIQKDLDVEVPLRVLFRNPTIKNLAKYIQTADEVRYNPIKAVEEREFYPVSSAQKRSFVLNQLDKASVGYNIPIMLWIQGMIDKVRLENSFKGLIERHETLRTSFHSSDGEILQKVHQDVNFTIDYFETEESMLDNIIEDFIRPFNLKKAPLLRVALVKVSEDKHLLLFDMYHIISDAVSIEIMMENIAKLYFGETLPPLSVQYKDYAVWQNQLINSGVIEEQEKYWLERFAKPVPPLNLFTDYPRPSRQSFVGNTFSFMVESGLKDKLNSLARSNSATLYMVLLASFKILLAKYSGQEDIVVGSPIAGRNHPDLQGVIGMFINTLVMRNYPVQEKSFQEFLMEVKENALLAYENQDYQFEQLVEKLDIMRDASRNPLFDYMLVLQNANSTDLSIRDLEFDYYDYKNPVSKVDISLIANETDDGIIFDLQYCTSLFKESTMERMAQHYTNILEKISEESDILLKDIELITDVEKRKIVEEFNYTSREFESDKTIQQLIDEQVQKTPEKIALQYGDEEMTYRELNEKSNQLAALLNQKGAGNETFCGIMVERSLSMIVGILGILKSGAAYLPIDPDYPQKRIEYVLKDSQAGFVLTEKKYSTLLANLEIEIIDIEEGLELSTELAYKTHSDPTNIAYIIYTSGSTGLPKGVVVEHKSVNNFIRGITDIIEFDEDKIILALTTMSFDIFGLETLLPLTQGTKIVIANQDEQKDPRALARLIVKKEINMIQMTPSRAKLLLKVLKEQPEKSYLKRVRQIMIGGEALPENLLQDLKELTYARIYNMYGPTETTIWSSVKELTDQKEITIGKPIANTEMYIVNKSGGLQPIGVPGELCIGGEGLARGYWRRNELTSEKFVLNSFHTELQEQGNENRMYRTGDLARWLEDGEIQFLGRMDNQMKIRGYRIEPGEIEQKMMEHERVQETVVVEGKDTKGESYFASYIVGDDDLEVSALKEDLAHELPQYMIPDYFIKLDQLPLTPNGKVDRNKLPVPDANLISGTEYVAPSNEIEEKLVRFWEEVLGIEGIGVNHNFFEIGGNSLNIIEIINKIRREFIVEVPMGEMFLRPTISELANNLFIDNPLSGLECTIQLNKPTEGKKNIFMIHNWQGLIYQYKELAKLLEEEYNVYGIQAKGIMEPTPLPATAEEMVTEYIVEMKKVQPEGPYIIAGFCYGNWLAYKMVQMLEYRGVQVEKMIMIDESVLLPDMVVKYLQVRTILLKPYRWLKGIFTRMVKGADYNPMNYWPDIEDYQRKNKQTKSDISVRDNIEYMSTRIFNIKHIINTDTLIIKAEETNRPKLTREAWQELCKGEVDFTVIPGEHHGIFNPPYVEELAVKFREALKE